MNKKFKELKNFELFRVASDGPDDILLMKMMIRNENYVFFTRRKKEEYGLYLPLEKGIVKSSLTSLGFNLKYLQLLERFLLKNTKITMFAGMPGTWRRIRLNGQIDLTT